MRVGWAGLDHHPPPISASVEDLSSGRGRDREREKKKKKASLGRDTLTLLTTGLDRRLSY